jgi:uncharacterized protein with HEPN domain
MVNQYESKLEQYLRWIDEIIIKIESYADVSYEDFCADEMRKDECITALMQLWEIANIIKKHQYEPYNMSLSLKEMAEMRNFLVHSYHRVDIEILWKTMTESVPSLKKQLQHIS